MRQAARGGAASIGVLLASAWLLAPSLGLAQPPSASTASQDQGTSPDNATSQDATSAGCFTVVMPVAGGAPHTPLLLDQCTGASWLLVRDPVAQLQPDGGPQFRYRWFPLAIASAEAVMADAPVSETAPAAKSAALAPPSPRQAASPKASLPASLPASSPASPPASNAAATVAREDKRVPVKEN
jgi:hypothetical protein